MHKKGLKQLLSGSRVFLVVIAIHTVLCGTVPCLRRSLCPMTKLCWTRHAAT